jgi:hypothetical protein
MGHLKDFSGSPQTSHKRSQKMRQRSHKDVEIWMKSHQKVTCPVGQIDDTNCHPMCVMPLLVLPHGNLLQIFFSYQRCLYL